MVWYFVIHPCMCVALRGEWPSEQTDSTSRRPQRKTSCWGSQVWATHIRLSRVKPITVSGPRASQDHVIYTWYGCHGSGLDPAKTAERRATGKRWLRPRINNHPSLTLWREKIIKINITWIPLNYCHYLLFDYLHIIFNIQNILHIKHCLKKTQVTLQTIKLFWIN